MAEKICLDSDIIIDILNNKKEVKEILESIGKEFYTTSINIFEAWYGRKDTEKIENLISALYKLSFDEKSAKLAAQILTELKDKGNLIEPRDMFIGAICIANEIALFTKNKKHFERLEKFGLKLI